MINLQDIYLKRGSKHLFEGLNLTVHAGHRLGIVGRNGSGKTSLFLLLRSRLIPDEGDVKLPRSWVIAHLEQEVAPTERPALEWVVDGDRPLRRIQAEIAAAESRGDHVRLAKLYSDIETIDGYAAEARAGQILHGLGFEGEEFGQPVSAFSGGWQIRLHLGRTLMCRSDLLLLDEPTNHLDLDATIWLEQWLTRRAETTLVISHDRDFLDRVTTDIAHLEGGKARSYRGNYSSFERQRAESLARERAMYEQQQRRVNEIRAFVNRFRAKATKARQAQSRLKELERMELIAPAHVDSPYRFSFPNPERASNPLIHMERATMGYDGSPVLSEVRFTLSPGDRIGLLGKNGAGKSTFMRSIAGEQPLMGGACKRGRYATVGYFTQHTLDSLMPAKTPMQHLHAVDPKLTEQQMRQFLGGWGFPGESALSPASNLSGGEKARLALALLAARRPALLLLDEPTNHLDLEMRHALTLALQSFEGALLIISHDQHLVENTADELVMVADGRVQPYSGSLESYRDGLLARDKGIEQSNDGVDQSSRGAARRRENARERANLKPLRDSLRNLENEMDEIRTKIAPIAETLADSETYQRLDSQELTDLITRHQRYQKCLETLEDEWLTASTQLEEASS